MFLLEEAFCIVKNAKEAGETPQTAMQTQEFEFDPQNPREKKQKKKARHSVMYL